MEIQEGDISGCIIQSNEIKEMIDMAVRYNSDKLRGEEVVYDIERREVESRKMEGSEIQGKMNIFHQQFTWDLRFLPVKIQYMYSDRKD